MVKRVFLFALLGTLLASAARGAAQEPDRKRFREKQVLAAIEQVMQARPRVAWTLGDVQALSVKKPFLAKRASGPGAIAGTLFGLDDVALSTAVVVAWSSSPADPQPRAVFGQVTPGGEYVIKPLDPGEYYVLAVADGYVPKFYDNVTNFEEASTVPVEADSVSGGIDFFMEPLTPGTAVISGTVVDEMSGDPIPVGLVNVFSPDNPFLFGEAKTREDGSYVIRGLRSGTYVASAWAEGYLTEFYDNAATLEDATRIDVAEGDTVTGIDFSLSQGGIISGVVTNETGNPLAGVFVTAQIVGEPSTPPSGVGVDGWGYALTDENGQYEITGLVAGEYLVSAQLWERWLFVIEWYDNAATPEEATPVPVELGEEVTGIDFQLPAPTEFGEIAGQVVDADGKPIAGAFIEARAPFDPAEGGLQVWAYAFTDKEGRYAIEGLPAGRYLVSASAQEGWQFVRRWWPDAESPEQAEPVEVDPKTDTPPVDFVLPIAPGTAALAGHVRASTGEPLAFAFVEVRSADASQDPFSGSGLWAYANTDANGFYVIEGLPAGTYIAQAQYWEGERFGQQWYDHADDPAAATPIELADGDRRDDIDFDLELLPYFGALAGTVTDEQNAVPMERAYVEITPLDFDFVTAPITFWLYYAITNEGGNYQLEWLPRGNYLVAVYAQGAFEYFEDAVRPEDATPVEVVGGQTTAVNFGLTARDEGPGVIRGTVRDDWYGSPPEIAIVLAYPVATPAVVEESEGFFTAVTAPDGRYELRGLPVGEYLVFSFAPGFIGEYYDDVYDPEQATPVAVDGVNPTEGIDFKLAPMFILEADLASRAPSGATVFGQVVDRNGDPLPGTNVYLLGDDGRPVAFARSRADGRYELRNVAPGRYRLKATRPGYKSEYNDDAPEFEAAEPIDVTQGMVQVDFELAPQNVTGVPDQPSDLVPETLELYGNYPNPFNPETRISFGLPAQTEVKLRVFNLLGQEVARLVDGALGPGVHHVTWNGRDRSGRQVPSGLYFYALETPTHGVRVGKMTLLR